MTERPFVIGREAAEIINADTFIDEDDIPF